MIKLTEDYAMSIGKELRELVLEQHFNGLVEHSGGTHPAIGKFVLMMTVEEFKESLDFAIEERDRRCENAVSAHENQMEGGE